MVTPNYNAADQINDNSIMISVCEQSWDFVITRH